MLRDTRAYLVDECCPDERCSNSVPCLLKGAFPTRKTSADLEALLGGQVIGLLLSAQHWDCD